MELPTERNEIFSLFFHSHLVWITMSRRWHPARPNPRLARQSANLPRAREVRSPARGRTMRGGERVRAEFVPPEDWYEPTGRKSKDYRIVVCDPGPGFRHAVTADEVRRRLATLPPEMLAPLEVVQLSRMTRQKRTFPCYGMQWGSALYLYPVEESLIEYFARPPLPAERQEAAMFGGKWKCVAGQWQLIWTEASLKDFYLNNVLIHELGHLLDQRNTRYQDRERFAEWFAIHYGVSRNPAHANRRYRRPVRRHGPRR